MNDKLKLNSALYRKLYLLRRSEQEIKDYYFENEMKTPMHMSMGGEAITAGVCHALSDTDQVLGTYRSHALYLAKTQDVNAFFAEIYGRETGCAKGKAGSMHLCDPKKGHMGSSAVVASHISVGVGCAFANKYLQKDNVTAIFFGDAAADAGPFWESLNIACLLKLPVIFVCENNGLAVHTFNADRRGYVSLDKIVDQFNCSTFEAEATSVEEIYNLTQKAIQAMRETQSPSFLHLAYYRHLEHVGVEKDFQFGYRSKDVYEKWLEKDPISLQRQKLLRLGLFSGDLFAMEKTIDREVKRARELAKDTSFCEIDEVLRDIFYENS